MEILGRSGLRLLFLFPLLLLLHPSSSFQPGHRLDILKALGQQAALTTTTPQDLGAKLLHTLGELESGGSFITRTELECLLHQVQDRQALLSEVDGARANGGKHDGLDTTYSYQVLTEALKDVKSQQALHLWRRNVALRQNRVLMPARAAELYALMINTCLAEGEWELPRQ